MKRFNGLPLHVWGCTTPGMANYNPLANKNDGSCLAFDPDAIYIFDEGLDHYALVKSALIAGYGSDIDSRIERQDLGIEFYLEQLQTITGTLAAYSYAGVENQVSVAQNVWPDVLLCMPLGSNNYEELFHLSSIPVIVTVGAGDTQNRTAYGLGLEFWDDDNGASGDISSYSNGLIAGKLLKVKETRSCGWWEARYCARITASNNGVWDKFNGYGKIDVSAAVAFSGEIIPDPYD